MAEHDDWTAADDARVRAALTSLRTDVESTPLPDVRFVKARGMARRRRRFLTVGAAAAAAAVVAGTVGYGVLRPDANVVNLPAARTSTTTTTAAPSPTTSSSLDQPGLLPIAAEWETSLDLPAGSVRIIEAKTLEGGVECADPLGKPTLQQSLTQTNSPISGAATYWATGGDKAKASALAQSVSLCRAGPGFITTREYLGSYTIYSYSTKYAGSGWFAIVPGEDGLTLLQLIDPAFRDVKSGAFTATEIGALAEVAQARLERYAKGSSPSSTATSSSPKAIDQKMVVSGPDPVPSWNLFVAASQWTDPLFAKGAKAFAGGGSGFPDSSGAGLWAPCDTSGEMSGLGGLFGVVEVRAGSGDANVIGRQRVLVDQSAETSARKAWAKQTLGTYESLIAKECTAPTGTVSVAAGPNPGTYLVTTAVTQEATGEMHDFVGVTTGVTPGLLTTVNFFGTSDGQGFQGTPAQGFAELDRLLALARQK